MSSFYWMVYDGMQVDPVESASLLWYLNRTFYPTTYRDMERLAAFQNRVFRVWADAHHVPFIDVASRMPREPLLFGDAIHDTPSGWRIRAWLVFLDLVPIIEEAIQKGDLPKPAVVNYERHPNLPEPRYVDQVCP
jgi:hypothetical protein